MWIRINLEAGNVDRETYLPLARKLFRILKNIQIRMKLFSGKFKAEICLTNVDLTQHVQAVATGTARLMEMFGESLSVIYYTRGINKAVVCP
jgi:hypothetical protein